MLQHRAVRGLPRLPHPGGRALMPTVPLPRRVDPSINLNVLRRQAYTSVDADRFNQVLSGLLVNVR